MLTIKRTTLALMALVAMGPGVGAQEEGEDRSRQAYFEAVAEFFRMPRSEVSILGQWRLAPDEVPVALFLANRAGVSPEALVSLRRSGRGWAELVVRYHLNAAQFHVPLPDDASAGMLDRVYERYRGLPTGRWGEIALEDRDIVALVNLRLLAQTVRVAPAAILAMPWTGSWVEMYTNLIREP